jgi:electron transport complex protein RnfB
LERLPVDEVYDRLADALNRLPNSFPRTPSNVEIPLLKKIFSPEEASIASRMGREMEPLSTLAERFGLSAEEAEEKLMAMAGRVLLWRDRKDGERRFRLAPFIVGIYEAQLHEMDHEFAHLVEEYMADGGLAGIMRPQPTIHRVIPAHDAVKTEWVLPYDDVKAILLSNKTFSVRDCICRAQQEQVGRRCDFPLDICLSFSSRERPPRPGDISKEEALALLDKAEEIGLVHTVSNVMKGVGYVCNCCGCCCGILRAFTEFGVENSILAANYYAKIDPDVCVGCGICIDRCQMKAIIEEQGVAVVNLEECIGCGLCVTGCPNGAARLQKKPEEEIVHPPEDFAAWERERTTSRGLDK